MVAESWGQSMTDRRALIIGSWLAKGREKPSSQKIHSITDRWNKIFSQDWYEYRALKNKQSMPKPIHNPKLSDVIDQLRTADGVNADTELLIHFVGHSISVGEDDIDLILGTNKKGGDDRYCRLSLLVDITHQQSNFRRLVIILDTCHAGRTERSFQFIRKNTFAMFGTGDNYAFDASFSDGVLSALELDIKKNDQRIDRQAGGITYMKIFEDARRKVIGTNSNQKPQYYGDYGDELIKFAPTVIPVQFNPFASSRSVYGRVYRLLQIIKRDSPDWRQLRAAINKDAVFVLQRVEGGPSKFVSSERLAEYIDFLRRAKLLVQPKGQFKLTEAGLDACNAQRFNQAILKAIQKEVFSEEISLKFIEGIVKELLKDMIPPTPIRIKDRAAMKGKNLKLEAATRMAIQLLPSTGWFMKGSAEAIFPSELGGEFPHLLAG
jgi:hypothetical protein